MGIQGVPVALNNIYKLTKLINFDKIINYWCSSPKLKKDVENGTYINRKNT